MQEYKDGTFGVTKPLKELFEELKDNSEELEKTAAIHIGTKEELENKKEFLQIVKWYGESITEIKDKLNKIIKHFKIYDIIGD